MIRKRIARTLMLMMLYCSVATISLAYGQSADNVPDMLGIWYGQHFGAYPKGHSAYADERKWTEMELEIYKQEDNLIWTENRWRFVGENEWHREQATGTFSPYDNSALTIVESGATPETGSTGLFDGRLVDDQLYLLYKGIGNGITFATVLTKRMQ